MRTVKDFGRTKCHDEKKRRRKKLNSRSSTRPAFYKQEMEPDLRELATFQSRLLAFYQPRYGQDSRV